MFSFPDTYGRPPMGPSTWLSWLGALILSLISLLPLFMRRGLAHALAFLYAKYLGRNSRHVRTVNINLSACFPALNPSGKDALRHQYFVTLVMAVFMMPKQWWCGKSHFRNNTKTTGLEAVLEARKNKVPCVFLITHTVGLDAGMISLSLELPFTGFYKPFDNPVVDWLVRRSRLRFGGKPFARGEGFREIIRSVKQHDIL